METDDEALKRCSKICLYMDLKLWHDVISFTFYLKFLTLLSMSYQPCRREEKPIWTCEITTAFNEEKWWRWNLHLPKTFVSCYSQMWMNQEKAQVQANEEM